MSDNNGVEFTNTLGGYQSAICVFWGGGKGWEFVLITSNDLELKQVCRPKISMGIFKRQHR